MNTDDRYNGNLKPERLRDFIARNDEARKTEAKVAEEVLDKPQIRRAHHQPATKSKYTPHQGWRERERRKRQAA